MSLYLAKLRHPNIVWWGIAGIRSVAMRVEETINDFSAASYVQ